MSRRALKQRYNRDTRLKQTEKKYKSLFQLYCQKSIEVKFYKRHYSKQIRINIEQLLEKLYPFITLTKKLLSPGELSITYLYDEMYAAKVAGIIDCFLFKQTFIIVRERSLTGLRILWNHEQF